MTNNLAEYTAVIRGLQFLQENHLDGVRVRTDSQLVVRQLQGVYAVRSPAILPLYTDARALVEAMHPVLEWIPREQNTRADALTREAYAQARREAQGRQLPREVDPVDAVLARFDALPQSVTAWEAEFLESLLRQRRQGRALSPKQRTIIQRMAEQYLSPEAGAEVLGQARLL